MASAFSFFKSYLLNYASWVKSHQHITWPGKKKENICCPSQGLDKHSLRLHWKDGPARTRGRQRHNDGKWQRKQHQHWKTVRSLASTTKTKQKKKITWHLKEKLTEKISAALSRVTKPSVLLHITLLGWLKGWLTSWEHLVGQCYDTLASFNVPNQRQWSTQ